MSEHDFDIRSIVKTDAVDKDLVPSVERRVVVMDLGRLVFITLCILLVCAVCFTAGFWTGKKSVEQSSNTSLVDLPADGLFAVVPSEDESAASAAPIEGEEGAPVDPESAGDDPGQESSEPAQPESIQADQPPTEEIGLPESEGGDEGPGGSENTAQLHQTTLQDLSLSDLSNLMAFRC